MQVIPRILFASALAISLFGCAMPVVKPEQAASIKSIGVLSLLPSEELRYQKIGVTVFNNESASRPIQDQLNTSARLGAEKELSSYKNYQIKQMSADTQTLARRLRSFSLIVSSEVEPIRDDVAALAKQSDVDAVVVISERFDGENGVNGLRVLLSAGLGDIKWAVVRPDMNVSVISAKGELLAMARVGERYGRSIALAKPDGQIWFYQLEQNLDQATHDQAIKVLQGAVAREVANAVQKTGLRGQ
jgi:hypothetical protein